MVNIEELNKRLDGARHYITCPKARNECKQCDDWFYSSTSVQSIIRSLVTDIDSLMNSRDDIIRERDLLHSEFDELFARHLRLVDSTDTFVAALVDERFKKDHAVMIAELSGYRVCSVDVASTRANIDAIMRTNSIEPLPDDKSYAGKTFVIDRAIHNLRNECRQHLARINQLESADSSRIAELTSQLDKLRTEEKRLHSVVRSQNDAIAEYQDALRDVHKALGLPDSVNVIDGAKLIIEARDNAKQSSCKNGVHKVRPGERIQCVMSVNDSTVDADIHVRIGIEHDDTMLPANESTGQDVAKVEDKAKDATSANVVPDDVLKRASEWANKSTGYGPGGIDAYLARGVIEGFDMATDPSWNKAVREFVKLWRDGQAPDML